MKTNETLQLLHNIQGYIFSNFNDQCSTCLVVYKLKYHHEVTQVSNVSLLAITLTVGSIIIF